MADQKRSIFPTFSYPFCSDGSHQQSFVDYGSLSCYDIHIDEDDKSVYTTSKHSHHEESRNKFVAVQPTIPLLFSSETVFLSRNFPSVNPDRIFTVASNHDYSYEYPIIDQISDFYIDHPEVCFPEGLDIVHNECECAPWSLRSLFKKKIHTKYELNNPRLDQERFARLFVSSPLRKSADLFVYKNEVEMPQGLRETLLDIPPQVIFGMMNESIKQQKHEILHFDIFQGNTLRYCELPNNQRSNWLLFYPSGPNLDTLNMNGITLKHDQEDDDEYLSKPVLKDPCYTVPVNSAIRQIDTVSNECDGILVASRTQYSCLFFQVSGDAHKKLEAVETFKSDDEIIDLSLSPYIHGEAVITTTQGDIHICSHGKKTHTQNVPSLAPEEKWPWYQSVFGGHPRCILVANPVEVDLFDIRGNRPSRSFFSVKSKEADLHERISALQRHPDNTHHYFIATDQSLLIMDDRFLQHPVLKWHHHLQDPVQFIDIVPNAVPNCNDTVVLISGSVHHESHFYQYSNGQSVISPVLIDDCVVTPPMSTSLPWKMLPYHKWPSLLPYSDLPLSSVLEDRLNTSLIGVTCIPDKKRGLCVLQMSELGDMFYQPFVAKLTQEPHTSGSEPQSTFYLSMEEKQFCIEWIRDLIALEEKQYAEKNFDLKLNAVEIDCSKQFEKMINLETPHEACALCNNNCDEQLDDSLDDLVCERCGINIAAGRQLRKSSQQNDILTSQIYTLSKPASNLEIFPEEGTFQNSVSQGFRQNWLNDEPMPIEHNMKKIEETNENTVASQNDNVLSQMEPEMPVGLSQSAASTSEPISTATSFKVPNTKQPTSQTPSATSALLSHDDSIATKPPAQSTNLAISQTPSATSSALLSHENSIATKPPAQSTKLATSQTPSATSSALLSHNNSIATQPPADTRPTSQLNQKINSPVKNKKKKKALSMGF